MTQSILDMVITVIGTFGKFYTVLTTDLNQLANSTIFPNDMTLLSLMFGAGLLTFLGVTLVKWIL